MFGNYSKLIGAFIGNVIGVAIVWLATKGIATCLPGPTPDAEQVCTIAGFTSGQLTAGVMAIFNMALVYLFPANVPEKSAAKK